MTDLPWLIALFTRYRHTRYRLPIELRQDSRVSQVAQAQLFKDQAMTVQDKRLRRQVSGDKIGGYMSFGTAFPPL
jgi:hypothetical protein